RHQCGAGRSEAVRVRYAEAGVGHVEVEDFIADMASAYGWADLAITRAGAMTISELAAAGLPALLWPLPFSTDDHQRRNAERVSPPCGVIDSAESLGQHLPDWLGSRERLAERAAAMRAFHLPGAVESIVQTVLGEFA
ncbi:MAG: UDP-N-acetylglucosamine--N-acetylmuramyl-(pentapeptide) pyrophosphoryl-undecaprenol N-acetylglucosamine transferase, partial [Gammaproteobacteria bacterium AqS3]|nr:UDP-N-acetylglucosamine--N-acetylmuramyl-(pentapeptide) pyrophosphoryl-undecaprenol N-acetylglucosamine transferase [Gammaproteobacteria bacterium AqS3]